MSRELLHAAQHSARAVPARWLTARLADGPASYMRMWEYREYRPISARTTD